MPRTIRQLPHRALASVLAIGPLTLLLRELLGLVLRALDKVQRQLQAVHKNLPQAAKRLRERGATKTQTLSRYYLEVAERAAGLPLQPKISVIVPVYKVKADYLRECLLSVTRQPYPNWELCIVDDCSGQADLAAVLAEFQARHPGQVKVATNATNLHISATSNECLKLATGDYVGLLDHDDRLCLNALAEVVRYINLHDEPDVLYSDECTIDDHGDRIRPIFFKPDWSPFLHLTMNYTTHFSVYRRSLIEAVGGFRTGYEGSQDHDLMLRIVAATTKPVVHIPLCLYQWRAHQASTAKSQDAKPYAGLAGEKAVREALARRGRAATVEFQPETLLQRIRFALPTPTPLASVVIPSKDAPERLRRCLESLIDKTTYQAYEVIVSDNGTTDAATLALYEEMQARLGERFRVLLSPRPFNFGAQVNDGVRAARGSYVCLLNNDTEVIAPDWLGEMISLAQFPEVGAVGAKLLFRSGLVQHAGLALSTGQIAGEIGFLRKACDQHYWNTMNTVHETQAVTAACLVVTKAKYWEVGGLDALALPNAYGDLAFCLELRRRGYVNLYTPYASLYHDESASRGKSIEYFERFHLLSRYGQELAWDPYLNPNFQRNPRYEPNPYYLDLDLDQREFAFFLDHPPAAWRQRAARLAY